LGKRISPDGHYIAFDSYADLANENSGKNFASFALYLYDTTNNTFKRVGPRSDGDAAAGGGDVARYPGFTFDASNNPVLVLETRENIKADGTVPTTASDGLNPDVSRPVQIYHVKAAEHASARTTSSIVPRSTLRFHGVDVAGHTFALDVALEKLIATRSGLVIGRDSEQCELPLVHSTVSRRHARLFFAAEDLQIEDLGSTNGTLVNGAATRPGAPLAVRAGDKIRIGEIDFALSE
jgi:hypothetical protein